MRNNGTARIACLVISPASGLTGTDEALIARVKNRIWSQGHSLFHVNDRPSAESLLLEYGDRIGAIFVVATRSCYSTWLFVGATKSRNVAQFVIARFQLDEGGASFQNSGSRLIEIPAENPGIDPLLDVELHDFLLRLTQAHELPSTPDANKRVTPEQPVVRMTREQPVDSATSAVPASRLTGTNPAATGLTGIRHAATESTAAQLHATGLSAARITARCSDQELCTLQEIAAADQNGISLLKLGIRLNHHGIVRTMSLSVNGLRRKGLIQFNPPHAQAPAEGYVERNLCLSDAGRQYLEQHCHV